MQVSPHFKTPLRTALAALLASLCCVPAGSAEMALRRSARRLVNHQQGVFIVEYGTYGTLAEGALPGVEDPFDYEDFFAKLAANGVNGTRAWVFYQFANDLTPFQGVPQSSTDRDRRKRYSFEPNPAFYDRLEAFVAAANRRDIAVTLTLFDGVMLESGSDDDYHNRWVNCPFNRRNNTDRRALSSRTAFFTDSKIAAVQRQVIAQVVARTRPYGNVILELMNEPYSAHGATPDAVLGWHKRMSVYLKKALAHSASKVTQVNAPHPIDGPADKYRKLRDWANDSSSVDVVAFHLDPNDTTDRFDTGKLIKNKPIVLSNDGHHSCGAGVSDDELVRAITDWTAEALEADRRVDRIRGNGQVHVEFLSNNLTTHPAAGGDAQDYDPRSFFTSPRVLEALRRR